MDENRTNLYGISPHKPPPKRPRVAVGSARPDDIRDAYRTVPMRHRNRRPQLTLGRA